VLDQPLRLNVMQRGDALALLRLLPEAYTPLVFFDPQHRAVLEKLKFGNEGARQRGRAALPAISGEYIDSVCLAGEQSPEQADCDDDVGGTHELALDR
jgi:hypothetical protein